MAPIFYRASIAIHRRGANWEHISQSKPDSVLGFQAILLERLLSCSLSAEIQSGNRNGRARMLLDFLLDLAGGVSLVP